VEPWVVLFEQLLGGRQSKGGMVANIVLMVVEPQNTCKIRHILSERVKCEDELVGQLSKVIIGRRKHKEIHFRAFVFAID